MRTHAEIPGSNAARLLRRMLAAVAAAIVVAGCHTAPVTPDTTQNRQISPPQREALRALGFAETEEVWMLSMEGPVVFEVDSDVLTPDMADSIAKVAQGLLTVGIENVRVEGHTDSTGSRSHNVTLSKRRAAAVARQLADAGFPDAGIDQRALAYDYPLAPNATRAGRAQNRRVTITVIAPPVRP